MNNHVLVVDDEPLILKTVRRILENEGIKVVLAKSGFECLDIIKEGFRGLILMDIVMPEMDGWDTIQKLIDEGYTKGNIICMLTGKDIPDNKMDKLKEYVLDYIRKPFKNEELIAIVKEYLEYLQS